MKRIKMLSVALMLVGGTAAAGPRTSALPKEIQDMECLVGKWNGTATMKMGADTAHVKISWDCQRTSGDFGVQCKAVFKGIPGMDAYNETDLFGYDAGGKKYHWFSVTNGGETHDHMAPVSADNKIEFVYNGTQEGKPFKEVIHMTFGADSKSLELSSETFLDGQSTSVMQGKASKK